MMSPKTSNTQITIAIEPASMEIAQELSNWFFNHYGRSINIFSVRDIIRDCAVNIAAEQRIEKVAKRKITAGQLRSVRKNASPEVMREIDEKIISLEYNNKDKTRRRIKCN